MLVPAYPSLLRRTVFERAAPEWASKHSRMSAAFERKISKTLYDRPTIESPDWSPRVTEHRHRGDQAEVVTLRRPWNRVMAR